MRQYEVAVIGAGFAGIGAGIKLKQTHTSSFIIFERADDIGGTWRDNTYPGCACDIPSHLYSYSFEPNPNWSQIFSGHQEIQSYLKHCVKKYGIENHIQFHTEIKCIRFDESLGKWHITDQNANQYLARTIISASGPLNEPNYPKVKGRLKFKGESFHSMYWNHDYDLKGKKVAVIGTGASAIQFIPHIAPQVDNLTIFQRTPPWIQPKLDNTITDAAKARFKKFPAYQRFWRELIYWLLEYRGKIMYKPSKAREKRQLMCLNHMHKAIKEEILRKKLTPNYEIGCKRLLISNDYYPTLNRENVHLNTDTIIEITEHGIIDKTGKHHEVDCIIYGTGFTTTTFNHLYKVYGLGGRSLFEEWNEEGAHAYYGITIHNFPNFMMMVGPNTGLGHNSIIHMMESQLNYILDYLNQLLQQPDKYFNVKAAVQEAFNNDIQKKLKPMVWNQGGCSSYYLKNGNGKNTSIWPGSTIAYRKQTKKMKLADYDILNTKRVAIEPQTQKNNLNYSS